MQIRMTTCWAFTCLNAKWSLFAEHNVTAFLLQSTSYDWFHVQHLGLTTTMFFYLALCVASWACILQNSPESEQHKRQSGTHQNTWLVLLQSFIYCMQEIVLGLIVCITCTAREPARVHTHSKEKSPKLSAHTTRLCTACTTQGKGQTCKHMIGSTTQVQRCRSWVWMPHSPDLHTLRSMSCQPMESSSSRQPFHSLPSASLVRHKHKPMKQNASTSWSYVFLCFAHSALICSAWPSIASKNWQVVHLRICLMLSASQSELYISLHHARQTYTCAHTEICLLECGGKPRATAANISFYLITKC